MWCLRCGPAAGLAEVVGAVDGDDLDALDGALDHPGQCAGGGQFDDGGDAEVGQ
jgi:hypothetical protein